MFVQQEKEEKSEKHESKVVRSVIHTFPRPLFSTEKH